MTAGFALLWDSHFYVSRPRRPARRKGHDMDRNELEGKVLDMLEDICADEAVREERDIDLFDAGLLDSLAAIEVLVGIEENFGVEIAPTAVERKEMNTVNKIIEQIAARL